MSLHELAGKPVPETLRTNIQRLISDYYTLKPDPANPAQRIAFGTSGHRGSSHDTAFNEDHILAVAQAIAEHRAAQKITGPLYIGIDTHALSEPALRTALQVFAAHGIHTYIQENGGYTPTPVISHAILQHNKGRSHDLADGFIITPSHNPPRDGGIKYNPPNGGPADNDITQAMQARANQLLEDQLADVKTIPLQQALNAATTHHHDYITPYINDLDSVIDMQAIRDAKLKIGVDPMGGAGIAYWKPIAKKYGLDIQIVNHSLDPAFMFMRVDRDGKIRMDCSSPHAMAGLITLKDQFDIAFGNDPDFDRHGIVTKSSGLLNTNHYLAVAINYLFTHRPHWPTSAAIGKTLVSSSMIDRVAAHLKRPLAEVPVGFKWFVDGLHNGTYGFGGEESAGASFLRKDGSVWTTDKDGIILTLLAAEITAVTGKDPGQHYKELETQFAAPVYDRIDAPATPQQKKTLKALSPNQITATTLAGEPITAKLTHAPANNAPIGGLKVTTENGWFAARPSGTENIYKIYAESFNGTDHLKQLLTEAQAIVSTAFADAGVE